jgi:hypothetical protein
MKKFIVLLLVNYFILFSRQNEARKTTKGIMKMEELPAVVIKRVGTDFFSLSPDNHPDKDVRRMEEVSLMTLGKIMRVLKPTYY